MYTPNTNPQEHPMSAFTVNATHIDVIVNAARQLVAVSPDGEQLANESAAGIGQMLWLENYASVNHRYQEAGSAPRYTPTLTDEPLAPVAVLKAIDCYIYQSCEHPEWPTSDAKRFVDAVRGLIYGQHPELATLVGARHNIRQMVAAYTRTPEYDAAPWEVTSLDQVAAVIVKAEREQAVAEAAHAGEGAVYREVGRLNVTEIAKRMRVNLRNTQAAGMLPEGAKFSVTTERYSMGQSVTVTVKGMPDSWTYTTRETQWGTTENVHTDAARATVAAIEAMLGEYNRDRSDSMTDYYDVWFSASVNIESERSAAFWAGEKARKAARKARRSL